MMKDELNGIKRPIRNKELKKSRNLNKNQAELKPTTSGIYKHDQNFKFNKKYRKASNNNQKFGIESNSNKWSFKSRMEDTDRIHLYI